MNKINIPVIFLLASLATADFFTFEARAASGKNDEPQWESGRQTNSLKKSHKIKKRRKTDSNQSMWSISRKGDMNKTQPLKSNKH
ncbi:MAG: hypothetical protein JWP45_1221 [Mucilaginibacter sp.]|nr:hypothetical protein [Mucilaginibacter sp.]